MNYYEKMSKPTQTKVDYSKGFIYKLRCRDRRIPDIYGGSSTNKAQRKQCHKTRCNNPKNTKHNFYVYQFIRAHGGWDNWEMVVIKLYPCNSKMELEMEEQMMIDELGATLNSQRAYISEETHKEEQVKYREKNREKRNTQKKEHYQKNKGEILEKQRLYYVEQHEKIKERVNKYRKTHKEEIRERKAQKYTCHCGKTLTKDRKARHERSLYHQAWLAMPAPILLFID